MPFTVSLDVSYDSPIGEVLDVMKKHGATITRFVPNGPGGGNPYITFELESREKAEEFVQELYDEDDVSEYLES